MIDLYFYIRYNIMNTINNNEWYYFISYNKGK